MDELATGWICDLELPAHATSASRARRFVGQRLVEHELQDLVDDVQLVVSELASNALTHARTPFTVTLAAGEQSLLVKVRDGSPCHPVIVDATPLDSAGRGVTLVARLSRDWGVTAHADGGKTVWAAFDIPGPRPHAWFDHIRAGVIAPRRSPRGDPPGDRRLARRARDRGRS